jgi:hypothetical protein
MIFRPVLIVNYTFKHGESDSDIRFLRFTLLSDKCPAQMSSATSAPSRADVSGSSGYIFCHWFRLFDDRGTTFFSLSKFFFWFLLLDRSHIAMGRWDEQRETITLLSETMAWALARWHEQWEEGMSTGKMAWAMGRRHEHWKDGMSNGKIFYFYFSPFGSPYVYPFLPLVGFSKFNFFRFFFSPIVGTHPRFVSLLAR